MRSFASGSDSDRSRAVRRVRAALGIAASSESLASDSLDFDRNRLLAVSPQREIQKNFWHGKPTLTRASKVESCSRKCCRKTLLRFRNRISQNYENPCVIAISHA